MVFKTTFGQTQRWSLIRDTLGVENEEKNNLNFANKVLRRYNVLILGGLNSGISLYLPKFIISVGSWFASPLLSGGMSTALFFFISRVVLTKVKDLFYYLAVC